MTMTGERMLSLAERMKFRVLSEGIQLSEPAAAHIDRANSGRAMTPADYASTSGIILELDAEVWVNAPIARYNPTLVVDPALLLDLADDRLVLVGDDGSVPARFWLPPAYHDARNEWGEPYTSYAFTHGDRVRISPIEGCSMTCKFCNLPYEFRYRTKRVEGLVDAVRTALADPVQPAHHVLISGGTPHARDVGYVRSVYEAVIAGFPGVAVDIMMVPRDDLMDPEWLRDLGVNELSVNVEVFNAELGRKLMRQKAAQGLDTYLEYLERAAGILGPGRVRSMLMVGLEPLDDLLAGVEAIASRGAVPVLSPFRPDESTPLAGHAVWDARQLEEAYLQARDVARSHGVALGPSCVPCSHNTMTLAADVDAERSFGHPRMV